MPQVAALVLAELQRDGVSRLQFWAGSWWFWYAGRYTELDDKAVRALVTRRFAGEYRGVKSSHVTDVIEHLRAANMLSSTLSQPMWLPGTRVDWPVAECLATRDVIVHLTSLVEGVVPATIPATPRLFTTVATEFDFATNAAEPFEWLKFLKQLWPNDPESISTLQELFGYMLTPETRQQKLFTLIGPRRSGKGTIARILRRLVGDGNVCGPTLSGLAGEFGLEQTLGKSVAIVSDVRIGRADRSVIVERLLAISGEDKLSVNRKHRTAVHCQLPVRFVLLSNELPRLDDASATIVSRMIVLCTTESFYGREDQDLESRLVAELPGILLWAIDGWQRLRERGRFVQPGSAIDLINEMEALASPITAFINERCTIGSGDSVAVRDLFDAYRSWSDSNGWEHMPTVQRFGRDLRAAVPGLQNSRPDSGDARQRIYLGIGLRPDFN